MIKRKVTQFYRPRDDKKEDSNCDMLNELNRLISIIFYLDIFSLL